MRDSIVDPVTMLAIALVVCGLMMICSGMAPASKPTIVQSLSGLQVAAIIAFVVGVVVAFSELY
jgi:hypothetical protein